MRALDQAGAKHSQSPTNAGGAPVMELTYASEFRCLWSILLSPENFTSEETGSQVMKGAGNRAMSPQRVSPGWHMLPVTRVANPMLAARRRHGSFLVLRQRIGRTSRLCRQLLAGRSYFPRFNAIYAARMAMTLVIAHDAEHVASALAMVIARRCSPRKGQEKRTISVTQFEDRCVCFHPSTGFPSSRPRRRTTDLAIIISSSVRMTRTATRPPSFEIKDAFFALRSSFN